MKTTLSYFLRDLADGAVTNTFRHPSVQGIETFETADLSHARAIAETFRQMQAPKRLLLDVKT